ncbi:hypothetical protein [Aquimarina litoralis]|uniref:hypothetical protein n=1 Tax=Aquimarina litoralis TaxID=584605 RepID=UPI001C562034|nr:hypothetical protein [Aquimarina litoralis]MBW1296403.1 hypothetical protein [Aquimarina litoralis]
MCTKFWNEWNEQQTSQIIESSDIIFIGKLMASSNDCYEFEVIDVFKGSVNIGATLEGYYLTSCSGLPNVKGKWIFYGNYRLRNDNRVLNYSQCSPTRNLSRISRKRKQEYLDKELKLLNTCFDKNIVL